MVLCESLIADEFLSLDAETAADYAPYLLQLVDANGLQNLQLVVLNYVSGVRIAPGSDFKFA